MSLAQQIKELKDKHNAFVEKQDKEYKAFEQLMVQKVQEKGHDYSLKEQASLQQMNKDIDKAIADADEKLSKLTQQHDNKSTN